MGLHTYSEMRNNSLHSLPAPIPQSYSFIFCMDTNFGTGINDTLISYEGSCVHTVILIFILLSAVMTT